MSGRASQIIKKRKGRKRLSIVCVLFCVKYSIMNREYRKQTGEYRKWETVYIWSADLESVEICL